MSVDADGAIDARTKGEVRSRSAVRFVCYAQNSEDVVLWRALKGVDGGFYIDVGANDPVIDSVTKAFYERGWRGVNLEPVPYWHNRLKEDRPEDRNLRLAVSSGEEAIELYEVVGTGLSTSVVGIAERHEAGGLEVRKLSVPAKALDVICIDEGVTDIHFLKIDVEGAERAVLEGFSLEKFRPWIIVVEANDPNSTVSSHDAWEALITDRRYRFAYYDGLNRFYVADEHSDLKSSLHAPNCFDDSVRYETIQLQRLVLEHQGLVGALEKEIATEKTAREATATELATNQELSRSLRAERDDAHARELAQQDVHEGEIAVLSQRLQKSKEQAAEEHERVYLLLEELAEMKATNFHWWRVATVRGEELDQVYGSRSQQITKPLRSINHFCRNWRVLSRQRLKRLILGVLRPVQRIHWLRAIAKVTLSMLPPLKRRLRALDAAAREPVANSEFLKQHEPLPPVAEEIYTQLAACLAPIESN